jgi:hypothetical protein
MQKILLFNAILFLSGIVAFGQCANSGLTFGFATAPSTPGATQVITTCNYYGEAPTVDGFLSSLMYTLNNADGGLVTVFDASNTVVASGSVPFTFIPPSDGTFYPQWNGFGCTEDMDCHITSVTCIGSSSACTNPVFAGATTASVTTACDGYAFTLSLTGAAVGSGLSYQWQSSLNGTTWSDIIGANGSTASVSQTVMTYYRCIVTCSAGSTANSTALMVDMGQCISMTNGSVIACSGNFFDSGGPSGNYQDFENYTFTITPSTPGALLQVNFTSFNVETFFESMAVYNGNSTAAPLMGEFDTNPGSITSGAADGSLTFVFTSDGSFNLSGWQATLSCVLPPSNDLPCNAILLPVDGSVGTFNNGGASVDANEILVAPATTGDNETDGWGESTLSFTTWFKFVAPASGNLTIDCTGNSFDGQIALYNASSCGNYTTYSFVAGNDDAMDLSSPAPYFTTCGLTPGGTYYMMFDSRSTIASGEFKIALSPLTVNAGTFTNVLDVCSGDVVDLFTGISGNDSGGVWSEMTPTVNLNDSLFNSAGLAYTTFDFEYVVTIGCASDTSSAQVQIFGPSLAGSNGTLEVCRNENFNLLDGLIGTVDLGGTWYDPSNIAITGNMYTSSNIPGQYNFDYITNNGVCPNDTANVLVNVLNCVAGIDENVLIDMTVYPNPTTGVLFINNSASAEMFNYMVTDLNGRTVAREFNAVAGSKVTEVNLDSLNTGMYLVRVYNTTGERTFRIIMN